MDLFGGTEFIAPDVLFKAVNASAPKKDYTDRCPSGGLAAAHAFQFGFKINK